MYDLIRKELENAPETVRHLYEDLEKDNRIRFIDAYMGGTLAYGGARVLVVECKVKEETYFNEETYFLPNDIIRFEIGIGEDFDNKFPVTVYKTGELGKCFQETEIDFERKQLE